MASFAFVLFLSSLAVTAVSGQVNYTEKVATDAYIYFYPIVENLKTLFYVGVWPHTSSFDNLVGSNKFKHVAALLDYRFTAIVTPNVDTLYSQAWLDLDKGPVILSLPEVLNQRYYSMQIVDGYTFNIKTISPRTTGSWEAAEYLIIGPNCKKTETSNFDKDHTIKSSSRFVFVLGRTGIYAPDDLSKAMTVQNGYVLSPLVSSKCKDVDEELPIFPFIDAAELGKSSPEPEIFFSYANFIMEYIHIEKREFKLFKQFSEFNIGPGYTFAGQEFSAEDYQAFKDGMAKGSRIIDVAPISHQFGNLGNNWVTVVDPPVFGTPEVLEGEYLRRAYAASFGLYGNDPAEAYYPLATLDSDSALLDSAQHNYLIRFDPGSFPALQTGGFWSITMYRLPEKLLVHNPINRYAIGSNTEGLVYDTDGSLTLYIQKDQPAAGTSNWLPAPKVGDATYGNYKTGTFNLLMRIYWPTAATLAGPYFPPAVQKSGTPAN